MPLQKRVLINIDKIAKNRASETRKIAFSTGAKSGNPKKRKRQNGRTLVDAFVSTCKSGFALIFRLRNDFAVRKRGAERVGPGFGRFRAGNVYFRQFT